MAQGNLEKRLFSQARSGVVGAVDPSTGKVLMWHRDIGHSWRFIVHEALTSANEALGNDPEVFEILSHISNGLSEIYAHSLTDNHKGMSGFRELYAYVDSKGEKGATAYATFSAFVVQSLFCFLFTGRKLAIGLPQNLDNEKVHEFHSSLSYLALLDDPVRIEAAKQFRDRGVWPNTVDTSNMLRRLDDFLGVMLEDKEVSYKEDAAKNTKTKKNKKR